jgi:6-pyruvoyltetrahydropterin/6-carboxytetrahydropterin synthase
VERTIEGIRNLVDHRYLNDVPGLEVPSLENVARWLWQRLDAELPGVKSVKLCRGNDGQAEGCIYSGERDRPARKATRELEALVAG